MGHDCTSGACATRRDMLKIGAAGLTWGMFGLSLPTKLFLQEAYGITPVNPLYDAVIQIFYNGGPSQTDTWDPKPGSQNNVFNTIDVGSKDIYGNPIKVGEHFTNIVNLIQKDPANFGLGLIRGMTHGNGDHGTAEGYMNCFWQSPLANVYPSTASVMAYYFQGQGLGIPSVVISGGNGQDANNGKGADIPTALEVNAGDNQGNNPTVQALSLPNGVDANRYARRQRMMQKINEKILGSRPDSTVKAYDKAWKDAYDITTKGQAATAFDLKNKTILPGGGNANPNDLKRLTLAQELVKAGVPYVAAGIDGNDTHSGNRAGVSMNWGDITDPAVAMMAQNLKAAGKRVLIVMGGEFGRTPDSVQGGRDGRDHYPDGFSWAVLSVGQPKFKTNAVGDTGPDGTFTMKDGNLKDPTAPGVLGGMIYNALGFPIGSDPKWDVPTAVRLAPPVDRQMALVDAPKLAKSFGLA